MVFELLISDESAALTALIRNPLRSALIRTLESLHLADAARAAKKVATQYFRGVRKSLQARTLLFWRPLVPADRFIQCCRHAIRVLRSRISNLGNACYLEFGVSRGTSLACMFHALQSERLPHVRLVGFDSFQGLPPEAAQEGWSPGSFWSERSATERYLRQSGVDMDRVTLVEGWFKDTLADETKDRLGIEAASFIMIDCDTYAASQAALWFCESLIRDKAVIFLDDWGSRPGKGQVGQREAFDQFLTAFTDLRAEPLPAYIPQARVFLITREAA